MFDQIIEGARYVAVQLLPIVGIIALIFLIWFLWKLIKLMGDLNITVNKVNKTIDTVDQSIEKLQAPLTTFTNITGTVDSIYSSAMKVSNTFLNVLMDNLDVIKKWFSGLFKKNKDEVVVKETDEVVPTDLVNQEGE